MKLLLLTASAYALVPSRKLAPGPRYASARREETMVLGAVGAGALRYAVPAVAGLYAARAVKRKLAKGSRPYDREANSVGREYDAWTREGILEHYWGEHIHLGYYTDEEMEKGYLKKDFIEAKLNFTQRMMAWGGVNDATTAAGGKDVKILDVGCGIGGTTRYMATQLPEAKITGITLSPEQRDRATALAKEQGITNVDFMVKDALAMDFADESFDVVWGCESGEHMPDKKKYVTEMARVLRPGGKQVVATWCQRDNATQAFTAEEADSLDFLYSEWTHPYFISVNDYARLFASEAGLKDVVQDDWAKETIASWRHSIWVGVFDPWPVVFAGPRMWWKCFRDGVCLERMHKAFDRGLMEYGMIKGTKPLSA